MPLTYVVEHMEPELDEWSEVSPLATNLSLSLLATKPGEPQLEYANIRKHVGPNRLILSHVDPTLLARLPERIRPENGIIITEKPILDIEGVEKSKVILLDPQATEELVPEDGDKFEYFLFGGILVGPEICDVLWITFLNEVTSG